MTTTASPPDPRVAGHARGSNPQTTEWLASLDRGITVARAQEADEERVRKLVAQEAKNKSTAPPHRDLPARPIAPRLSRETVREPVAPTRLAPTVHPGSWREQLQAAFRGIKKTREAKALHAAWAEVLRNTERGQSLRGEYVTDVLNSLDEPDLCAVEVAAVELGVSEAVLREKLGGDIVDRVLDEHDNGAPFDRIAEQVAQSAPTWPWQRDLGEDRPLSQEASGATSTATGLPTVRWMGQHISPGERAVNERAVDTVPVLAQDTFERGVTNLSMSAPSVERPTLEPEVTRENQGPASGGRTGPGTEYRLVADNGRLVDQPALKVSSAQTELPPIPDPVREPVKEEVVERILARNEPAELNITDTLADVPSNDALSLPARSHALIEERDIATTITPIDVFTDIPLELDQDTTGTGTTTPQCEFDHALTGGIDVEPATLAPEVPENELELDTPACVELTVPDSTPDLTSPVAPARTGGDATKLWVEGLRGNADKQLVGGWQQGEDRCAVYQGVVSTGLSVGQLEERYGDVVPDAMLRNDWHGESFNQIADHIEKVAPPVEIECDGMTR